MFNLQEAIATWKQELRRSPAFEDGDIAELESHLREEVERLMVEGLSAEEAFIRAAAEIGDSGTLGVELFRSRASQKTGPVPPWKQNPWIPSLLPNYLKVALRNFQRQFGYTAINVVGLAVGLACCLFVYLYVMDELSYDRFHEKGERIYKMAWKGKSQDDSQARKLMPSAMAPALVEEIPEVEKAVRLAGVRNDVKISSGGEGFYEQGFHYADPSFFEVFSFDLEHGDSETALDEPYSIVLTEQTAAKYFGDANPVGQTLRIDNEHLFQVTGVLEELPANTHLKFQFLASYASRALINPRQEESWLGFWDDTYVLLGPRASREQVLAKLPELVVDHMRADFGDGPADGMGAQMAFLMQPVQDIHLRGVPVPESDIRYIYLFSVIAFLILFIACINYMNLSTAQFTQRAREVGLRKVIGAQRRQIIGQFMSEAVITSLTALALALVCAGFFLPVFNAFTGKSLSMNLFGDPLLLIIMFAVALGTGIVAGSYPALFLSGFKPVSILRNRINRGVMSTALFRKVLVIFQFSVSVTLIITTLVIQKQLDYVQGKRLGFNKEQAIVIPTRYHLGDRYTTFKNELLRNPEITSVTTSSGVPADPSYAQLKMDVEGVGGDQWITAYSVDTDFVRTLGIEMAAGRDFENRSPADNETYVLVNETAVRTFGWDVPLGKTITVTGIPKTVIGVVSDFHYQSLHEEITPVVIETHESASQYVIARLKTRDLSGVLYFVALQWEQIVPDWPFEYAFLDQKYEQLYAGEQRLAQAFGYFSGLAILVACLGLFGLVSFMAERRTKEIGIRKVHGASPAGIVWLISKEYALLIVIAALIAVPVGYYAVNRWLMDFAYRTEINAKVFLLATSIALVLAFVAVLRQSLRAANLNPTTSLRSE